MKAVFVSEGADAEPVVHTDREAFNLLSAPAIRNGGCFEPVLQALLGFESYNRFAKEAKLRPIRLPRTKWDPAVMPLLGGMRVVVDL